MWKLIRNYWYLVPFVLWVFIMFIAGLANDLCGGCVAKQGNLLTICCGFN